MNHWVGRLCAQKIKLYKIFNCAETNAVQEREPTGTREIEIF